MLRLFYVAYFAGTGVLLPFFPPYLRNLGFSGRQVSLVMSLGALFSLAASLLWGRLADRTGRPAAVLRVASAGAAACLIPLIFVRTMPGILLVYAAHQLFAVALMGLADSLAAERARQHGEDYGRLRLCGSASFIVACWAAGQLLVARGQRADRLVPLLMAVAFTLTALASLGVTSPARIDRRAPPRAGELGVLLRDRRFVFLIGLAPLHWAGNAAYNGFFSILLQDRGLAASTASTAFVMGVTGELGAFFFFQRLRARVPLSGLLALSFAAGAVRWLVVACARSAALLVAVQLLHTFTFGVFWAAAVAWLGSCVPARLRATGQTTFTAATLGVGNLIGMLGAGALYDATGAASAAFVAAATADLLALLLAAVLARQLRTA
jgi:PPP family 3-phenylpropionic acid transporter